jgi:hypothetical protein
MDDGKLKMIMAIATETAVKISSEISQMETGSCKFSQACDDLKDATEAMKNICKIMHYHEEDHNKPSEAKKA